MAGLNWVESTFCKRECSKFIPSAKDNARCCCGNLWQFHRDGSPATLRNQESEELHWSPTRHTCLHPTDAYGTIEFHGGPHPTKAQYIRLAHDTPPNVILELFTREWGLALPKLLISIQGGKANFELQPKLKKVIRKGLLTAAKTTGAWVFTGGLNTGVTRQAGEALASETTLRDRSGRIVSVGIAPWGIVERRQELIGKNKDVPYLPVNSPKSRYAALNSHHTYFLLIDNGTSGKYGPEIVLRRKLENYISQQRIETRGGLATPVVCVVIEGGPQTIRQVLEYVTDSPPLPVIVCDGTGRAADILAFVHKYAVSGPNILENNRASIVSTLERVFELRIEQAEKLFLELMQCVKKKDMITVFRWKEGAELLDQSILSALLHSKRLSPPEQLSLALTWNRVDIARSHVFNENVEWPQGSLEQAMMDALVNNRIEFVKLLLEQGVSMTKFLTVQRLEDLYNATHSTPDTLQYIIKDVRKNNTNSRDCKYSLIDIGLTINKLMGGAFRSSYTRKKFRSALANLKPVAFGSDVTNGSLFLACQSTPLRKLIRHESQREHHQPVFDYPFSELMVWAVLTKRQPLALLMWQHGEEAVAKALVAAKLYKALAHEGPDDDLETEVYEELRSYAKEFETHALEVLDYCYQQDEDRANQLLTYELKNWSKQTCLSLAVAVNHRAFLSHSCCQILLADLWLGGLRTRKSTNIKVILGLLFPPLIMVLSFRSREELRSMPQTCEEHWDELPNRYNDSETDSESDSENIDLRTEQEAEVPLFNQVNATHSHSNSTPISSPPAPPAGVDTVFRKSSGSFTHDNTFPLSSGKDGTFSDPTSKELLVRIKYYEFYNAPITKFWAHSIAFIFFLCLFTYVVLVRLPIVPEWPEWYVVAYIATFFCEKIREILSNEPDKLIKKLNVWAEKLWNVFDLIFTLFFLLGLCLRLQSGAVRDAGRVIYCVDIIYWYLKVLEILSANKYLGPLVMIMGKMVKNMAYFVILLLVVLMAFGVCRQSILFPNEEPHWRLARHIFYQPYFMLYGEVFAGDIDPPCGGPDEIECQPGMWITPTVMSVYLLIANILLINLLIAVFNNIFTSVNKISHQVWMFQRFQVVMEFEEKPVFPPPLILLSHIHRACKYIYRRWKGKPFMYDHGLKRFLGGENLERVHDFEEECVDSYMKEKEQKEHMSTEDRVRVMTERTEALTQRLDDMYSKVVLALTSVNNLDFHVKRLNDELHHVNANYATIHRFMLSYIKRPQSGSGSGSPGSGSGTPISGSQSSLHKMLMEGRESKQSEWKRQASIGEKGEEEESSDEEEEMTIRGRHGDHHIVKMSLHGKRKINKDVSEMEKEGHIWLDKREEPKKKVQKTDELLGAREKVIKERRISGGRRSSLKKSHRRQSSEEKKSFSPTRVSFRAQEAEAIPADETSFFRRSHSQPPEDEIPTFKYERCVSTPTRPLIQVIPPTTPPPPIITLTAEYTSLGDELETVCMSRLSPPASPHFFSNLASNQTHLRPRHRSDSAAPSEIYNSNPLRDAEEADYLLMEGIIQRRMHRDSENLAVSLEDIYSVFSEVSDDDEGKEKNTLAPQAGIRQRRTPEVWKRHSDCSLDPNVSEQRCSSVPPPPISMSPSPKGSAVFSTVVPLGSPTHNLQRLNSAHSWSLPVTTFTTSEQMFPRSISPRSLCLTLTAQPSNLPLFSPPPIPFFRQHSLGFTSMSDTRFSTKKSEKTTEQDNQQVPSMAEENEVKPSTPPETEC